jgi:hypothetical protein
MWDAAEAAEDAAIAAQVEALSAPPSIVPTQVLN